MLCRKSDKPCVMRPFAANPGSRNKIKPPLQQLMSIRKQFEKFQQAIYLPACYVGIPAVAILADRPSGNHPELDQNLRHHTQLGPPALQRLHRLTALIVLGICAVGSPWKDVCVEEVLLHHP